MYESEISFTLDTICGWYESSKMIYVIRNESAESLLGHIWRRRGLRFSKFATFKPIDNGQRLDLGAWPIIKAWIWFLVSSYGIWQTALEQFRSSPASKDVNFAVKYLPYQFYPEASNEGQDICDWHVLSTKKHFQSSSILIGTRRQDSTVRTTKWRNISHWLRLMA